MRRTLLAATFMTFVIVASGAQANAQTEPLLCNGLEPTVVIGAGALDRGQPTEGDDVIWMKTLSTDRFFALGGDDVICFFGWAGSELSGGDGDDTIILGSNPDPDAFRASGGFVYGRAGNDTIISVDGDHTIFGGDGDDTILGGSGDDVLLGEDGADEIRGGWGRDVIQGGDGDDLLFGGPGTDQVFGNLGADEFYGGPGNDRLYSNEGERVRRLHRETLSKDTAGAKMFGGPGNDLFYGSNRWDRMQGGPGDDYMWGFEGRDWMRGGPGDDGLVGGQGIDDMAGNTGADVIQGLNADIVNGGFGIDICSKYDWDEVGPTQNCESSPAPDIELYGIWY